MTNRVQVELTETDIELIHHALNNLPLKWTDYQKHGYENSMHLLVDSFPLVDNHIAEDIDQRVSELLSGPFEL